MSTSTDKSSTPAPAPAPASAGSGFMADLFNSIFTPSLNTIPQRIMNYSFIALFIVLTILVFLTHANPHVIALLTLSVGLWLSVNWFIKEIAKMPAARREVQHMPRTQQDEKEAEQHAKKEV